MAKTEPCPLHVLVQRNSLEITVQRIVALHPVSVDRGCREDEVIPTSTMMYLARNVNMENERAPHTWCSGTTELQK